MGLFDFLKKQKTDVEQYYEERDSQQQFSDYAQDANYTQGNDFGQESFRMTVDDVFSITGRGTVVVGQIEAGTVSVGEEIMIKRPDGSAFTVVVGGIEQFRKMLDTAHAGDNVGILLRDIKKSDVNSGDVLIK